MEAACILLVKWSNATVLCLLWDSKGYLSTCNWLNFLTEFSCFFLSQCDCLFFIFLTGLWTEGKSEIQLTNKSSAYSLMLISLTVACGCFPTPFYLSGRFIMSVLVSSLSEENQVQPCSISSKLQVEGFTCPAFLSL